MYNYLHIGSIVLVTNGDNNNTGGGVEHIIIVIVVVVTVTSGIGVSTVGIAVYKKKQKGNVKSISTDIHVAIHIHTCNYHI